MTETMECGCKLVRCCGQPIYNSDGVCRACAVDKVIPNCKSQATCTNGLKCWEAGCCLRDPVPRVKASPAAFRGYCEELGRIPEEGQAELEKMREAMATIENMARLCTSDPGVLAVIQKVADEALANA